jgi:hypothetical protein
MHRSFVLLPLALGAVLSLGCGTGSEVHPEGKEGSEEYGTARVAVSAAPDDALCLRVTAAGTRTVVQSFDLTPGRSALLEMTRLPLGSVRFNGGVFGVACSAVTNADAPNWISDPVTTTIMPGVVAQVHLVLVSNGRADIVITFADADVDAAKPDTPRMEAGPGTGTFDKRVAIGEDDAEEYTRPIDGGMEIGVDVTSSDLEMTTDIPVNRSQVIGLRFTGVAVPPGATIVAAYVQFTAKLQTDGNSMESDPAITTLTLKGQAADNPPTFPAVFMADISSRPTTTAQAVWSDIPRWPTADAAGPDQRTPSLAAIVQEIVNRPGWASGNAMVFVIAGTGTRSAHSFNTAGGTKAPLLHIDYATGPLVAGDAAADARVAD